MSIRLTADISHCVDLNCAGVGNIRCFTAVWVVFQMLTWPHRHCCWSTDLFCMENLWLSSTARGLQHDPMCVCVCVCMHACVLAHMGVWVLHVGERVGVFEWETTGRGREWVCANVHIYDIYGCQCVCACVNICVCYSHDPLLICFRNRTLFKGCMSSRVVLLVVFWRGGAMCCKQKPAKCALDICLFVLIQK